MWLENYFSLATMESYGQNPWELLRRVRLCLIWPRIFWLHNITFVIFFFIFTIKSYDAIEKIGVRFDVNAQKNFDKPFFFTHKTNRLICFLFTLWLRLRSFPNHTQRSSRYYAYLPSVSQMRASMIELIFYWEKKLIDLQVDLIFGEFRTRWFVWWNKKYNRLQLVVLVVSLKWSVLNEHIHLEPAQEVVGGLAS